MRLSPDAEELLTMGGRPRSTEDCRDWDCWGTEVLKREEGEEASKYW